MIRAKGSYLKRLTSGISIPSGDIGKSLQGSTPPSVFIGSWNYPLVYAGPLIAPVRDNASIMDSPESWISEKKTQEDIMSYRLNLVRGKQAVRIADLDNELVEKLQHIALASASVDSEAEFKSPPRGKTFSEEHIPFGPSAIIERFDACDAQWDRNLEKAYHDVDLKATEAVADLHLQGVPFSRIQKAFSVGAVGSGRRRRLVPTRWAITACDSTIGRSLLKKVKHYDVIESFELYESRSLNNYYAVLLIPTAWQHEWMEAFLHILGREELIFSDYEKNGGKRTYSRVGGCYYSSKMAVLEAMERQQKQAGAIIFREAYRGYIPLGVFNVRENVRNAMIQPPREFEDLKSGLNYISKKIALPLRRFILESSLLKEQLRCQQTTLSCF